jgi:hypothetical protein
VLFRSPIESIFHFSILEKFLGMVLGVGYHTNFSFMANSPLWFLFGLFFVKMIHGVVKIFAKYNKVFYILVNVLTITFVLLIKKIGKDIYFSIDSAFLAYPFFSIGYIIKKYFNKYCEIIQRNNLKITLLKVFIIIFSFFGVICLSTYNGGVDINYFEYGKNVFVFYLNGFVGILLIMCVSMLCLIKIKLVTIISKGTIIILAFHNCVAYELLRIFYKLFQINGNIPMRYAMPIAMIVVLLMVLPIVFVKKYFPIIMGGRK